MAAIVERVDVPIKRGVNASRSAARPHRFRDAPRQDVRFVVAGQRKANVRRRRARLKEQTRLRRDAAKNAGVEFVVEPSGAFRVALDNRYLVSLFAKKSCDGTSDVAAA
jgi:hypothetical protein